MTNGWICLHRKMLNTSWYGIKPDATLLAVHLLLSATHKDFNTSFGTRKGRLLRGQYISGRKALAKEIGISEMRVYRALKVLQGVDFLHIKTYNWYSVITICNYNAYQDKDPNIEQQFAQQSVPSAQQDVPSEQQDVLSDTAPGSVVNTKQQLTINNKTIIQWFEVLWANYPNKDGKKAALKHFMASVQTEEDYKNIQQALVNYKNSEKVLRGFIKMGSTWFNNWRDWITDPKSKPKERWTKEEIEEDSVWYERYTKGEISYEEYRTRDVKPKP